MTIRKDLFSVIVKIITDNSKLFFDFECDTFIYDLLFYIVVLILLFKIRILPPPLCLIHVDLTSDFLRQQH